MKPEKKARLEKAGFRVGSATEFLNLTPEDIALDNAISSAAAHNRAKGTTLALSKAEIARINRAQESIKPLPFHPVGTLPVTKRELAIERRADAAGKR